MRPNSPPQITSVSSSSPRRLRSTSRAAIGRVDFPAFFRQVLDDVVAGARAVAVPAPVEELDVPHAALDQAASQKAVVGERRGPGFRAILLQDRFGLLADIHDVGNGHLHPEGQLVLADPRQSLGIAKLGKLIFVELPERIESAPPIGPVHSFGIADVEDRIADGPALHPLVNAGQKAGAPEGFAAGRDRSRR